MFVRWEFIALTLIILAMAFFLPMFSINLSFAVMGAAIFLLLLQVMSRKYRPVFILLLIYIFFLPLDIIGYSSFKTLIPSIPYPLSILSIQTIFGLILITSIFLSKKKNDSSQLRIPTIWLWVLLLLWRSISVLWTVDFSQDSLLILFQNLYQMLLFISLIRYQYSLEELGIVKKTIIFSSAVVCIIGIVSYYFFPDLFVNQRASLFGSGVTDANLFAISLTLPLSILFCDFVFQVINIIWFLILSLLCVFSIGISGSRTGIISALVMFFAILCMSLPMLARKGAGKPNLNRIGSIVVISIIMVTFFILISPENILNRFSESEVWKDLEHRSRDIWQVGLEKWVEKPLFGWGTGSFRMIVGAGLVAHNDYVNILVENGLVGAALLLAALISLLFQKATNPFSIAFKAAAFGLLTASFFVNHMNYDLFWFTIALAQVRAIQLPCNLSDGLGCKAK
jgi:O-antigen ligase